MNPHPLVLIGGQYVRLICCLLLTIPHLQKVTCCKENEYLFQGRCCALCLPGHRVLRHCTNFFPTLCGRCAGGTYTESSNQLPTCHKCQLCNPVTGFRTVKKCIHTHNSVCTCKIAYFCKEKTPDGCLRCKKHYACPPGEGVKEQGTLLSDTVCHMCVNGTFSWRYSTHEPCVKWRDCDAINKIEVAPGTPHSNTKCAYPMPIVLPVSLVLSIIIVGILVWWWKRELRDRFRILLRQHLDRIRRIQLRENTRDTRKQSRKDSLTESHIHSIIETEGSASNISNISGTTFDTLGTGTKSGSEIKSELETLSNKAAEIS
ncbi:tumor necrosis factor receptor superfamily member 14-like isoform X2 [Callorhinchus milii]|nr:tumor necrosis factor receptor superfamily member 14-like isoform X2 [Callorhinchus milii]|eukprot:gi/632977607/ref/XP_007905441.1/ PREDICTED: tumor necrosis factor receptor superfamily member 5-like isoform X2 [Callorhinchus milii]